MTTTKMLEKVGGFEVWEVTEKGARSSSFRVLDPQGLLSGERGRAVGEPVRTFNTISAARRFCRQNTDS